MFERIFSINNLIPDIFLAKKLMNTILVSYHFVNPVALDYPTPNKKKTLHSHS